MRGFQPAAQRAAQQKKGYAEGGIVRGPGTGTSDEVPAEVPDGTYIMPADSTRQVGAEALGRMGARGFPIEGAGVPVNLSNGEFKLPPEQVHAVGVQTLDQIKAATHQPTARGFAPAARALAARGQEPEPRQFFADGGLVEDERRRPVSPSNIFPQASPSAGADIYGAAGKSVADRLGSSGQFANVPPSIGQQPGRTPAQSAAAGSTPGGTPTDAARQSLVDQIPTGRGFAPGAAAAPKLATAPVSSGDVPRGFRPGAEGFGTSSADPAPSPALAGGAPSARGFAPGSATAAPSPLAGGSGPRGFAPGAAAFAARTAGTAAPAPAAAPQTRGFPLPTPAPAPVPATEVEGWRTKAVMDGAAEDAKQAWDRGNVAGAAGAVARGALTAIPTAVGEFAYNTVAPLIGVARGFGEGLLGMTNEPAAPAPAATAPASGAGRGRVNPPLVNPNAPVPVSPAAPPSAAASSGNVTRVGNSYSGSNIAGDITVNGKAPGGGFMVAEAPAARGFHPGMRQVLAERAPSSAVGFPPGAEATANALAARSEAESLGRLMASGQIAAPQAGPSLILPGGNGFRRDSRFLAAELGAQRALDYAQGNDPASRSQAAGLQRTRMELQSQDQRAIQQNALERQRIGNEGRRIDIEQRRAEGVAEAQDYANRALAQQEQLRNVLADPNASVPAKMQAQKALRAMAGVKDSAKDRFLTVGGGQSVTKDGQTIKDPAQVYDTETGQWLQAPGQVGAGPIDQNAQALSIRDDPKMTREQKVEALRKLGYS